MTRSEQDPCQGDAEDNGGRVCGVIDDAGQGISIRNERDHLVVTVEWMHPDAFERAPGTTGLDGVKRWASGLARFRFSQRPLPFNTEESQ